MSSNFMKSTLTIVVKSKVLSYRCTHAENRSKLLRDLLGDVLLQILSHVAACHAEK